MAFFLACGLLAAARWLLEPERSWLVLASMFFAAAYVGLVVVARGRRMPTLLSAAAVGCALLPWRVFVAVNGLTTSDFHFSKSFDPSWVGSHIDRAPTAAVALAHHSLDMNRYALLVPLGAAALVVAFFSKARALAVFGAVFAALSISGLLWTYVISWIPLGQYLSQTQDRISAGLILACAALAPLLLSEADPWSPERADAGARIPAREGRSEAGAEANA